MKSQHFPGWAGPIVGPIAGVIVGYKYLLSDGIPDNAASLPILAACAGGGLVAGLIVWAWDRHSRRDERAVDDPLARLPPQGRPADDRPDERSSAVS